MERCETTTAVQCVWRFSRKNQNVSFHSIFFVVLFCRTHPNRSLYRSVIALITRLVRGPSVNTGSWDQSPASLRVITGAVIPLLNLAFFVVL